MESFSTQQLQAAIAQLDQALYNHEQWHKSVLRVLILHLPPDPPDLMQDAHRRCLFGQWYESLAAAFLRDHPSFHSLGPAHEKMHVCARALLQRVQDGLPISPNAFDQFNNALDRMRLEFQALRQELTDMMQNRDPLTGARNRSTLLPFLREQQALVKRGLQSCVIAMLDLDHFKDVNDTHGHTVGDAVLVALVGRLQQMIRPYDRIYRYGGEEFLICLPGMTLDEAGRAVERMRGAVACQAIPFDEAGRSLQVTISIGLAELSSTGSVEEAIDCADKAMYEAKEAGRNQVKWAV
ncbi:diguanylate cyclase [Gallaecimonas kandeliae]|uniref:diguanylate cyclase n=1 Tax=Gallaecimonas kandeliae TaxID=3029055 RepID=UPI002649563C|nr:diguanylate cyclase [Gallaecimonas kandeliae]WKE67002.1 diguanylate cyclase [Gallaecimonas kandeliae]